MTTRITCTDVETGESHTREITDDYMLICEGSAYLHYTAAHANGTHVLTVKGRKA